jgi:prepilin peptidase CpaA
MAFGGAMDMFTMTIPNRVSAVMVVGFLVLAPFLGLSWADFLGHLGAGAAMLLVGIALFAAGLIGGGDAKLFAAGALWVGLDYLLEFSLMMAVFGGLLTLILLVFRNLIPPRFVIRQKWAMRLHDPAVGIPYGLAISAAALAIYPLMPWAVRLAA